jgi:hypothetical protein
MQIRSPVKKIDRLRIEDIEGVVVIVRLPPDESERYALLSKSRFDPVSPGTCQENMNGIPFFTEGGNDLQQNFHPLLRFGTANIIHPGIPHEIADDIGIARNLEPIPELLPRWIMTGPEDLGKNGIGHIQNPES